MLTVDNVVIVTVVLSSASSCSVGGYDTALLYYVPVMRYYCLKLILKLIISSRVNYWLGSYL